MAEIEQASLKSEQLSDKSSSPALPDDLSLDEHTAYQLLAREGKVGVRFHCLKKNVECETHRCRYHEDGLFSVRPK